MAAAVALALLTRRALVVTSMAAALALLTRPALVVTYRARARVCGVCASYACDTNMSGNAVYCLLGMPYHAYVSCEFIWHGHSLTR